MTIKNLLSRWFLSQPLPYLKQGSTLAIRSHLKTDLRIRSHWRDDGQLSFAQRRIIPQSFGNNNGDDHNAENDAFAFILLSRNEDKTTSLGRTDPYISIDVLDKHGMEQFSMHDNGSNDNATKKLLLSLPLDKNKDSSEEVASDDDFKDQESCCLTLDIPDKMNIECDLTQGGSIFVEGKIEGDVRLKTAQGNISVSKLRGYNIELETGSTEIEERDVTPSSFIFVSETLECQSLRLSVSRPLLDRIRAKRIHAKTMEIQVGGYDSNEYIASIQTSGSNINATNGNEDEENDVTRQRQSILDEDDAGAICDIGSLYIIGDANINVQQPALVNDQCHRQRQAVRIKSHHGHVHIEATVPKPCYTNEITGDVLPVVLCGGVNGSCEVWVSQLKAYGDNDDNDNTVPFTVETDDDWTSCHIHFDSIAPDSVSLVHADGGNIHVTVDRKVEADVRLLSPPSNTNSSDKPLEVDMETLVLEDNDDGSLADEVSHMLQHIEGTVLSISGTKILNNSDGNGISTDSNRIQIQTNAFTTRERIKNEGLRYCEFVDGWIENTTSEPDSRFDRKLRGGFESADARGVGGKIRLEEAHSQALYGFAPPSKVSPTETASGRTFARPLLAVSSPGKITLETLSWLGNIARRYGLDDTRNEDDLGRQATRRKRLVKTPTNE
mmetsp:Transcript_2999/g.3397  ORF Transcript_2999/g.3397 Transcript_2999/m.3397 type:complete len:667 (+) Transcript_2999:28-2028(+)